MGQCDLHVWHRKPLACDKIAKICSLLSISILYFTCLLLCQAVGPQATTQLQPQSQSQSQARPPPPTVKSGGQKKNVFAQPNNIQPLLIQAATALATPPKLAVASASTPRSSNKVVPLPIGAANSQERLVTAPTSSTNNQDESITQLDYSSIDDEILRKRTANFVYFNANFNQCRNCARFFATWKELALDIRWWRQVVRLFTINCSDEDNIEVCRRAGVSQFPQVRFYWVMSNSLSQDGQRVRILGKSVHAMRHLIMDKVLDSYTEHNKLIAQRNQQRAQATNPLASLTALSNPASATSSPLASLMPLISQFLSNTKQAASGNQSGVATTGASSPSNPLTNIINMVTGKSAGGALSLTTLVDGLGGLQGIMNSLMSLASWKRSLTVQPIPKNWPELEALDVADTRSLLEMLPKGVTALLLMETQEFLYTGLEVMLDLNPYSNQTYIGRVRDERSLLTKNLTRRDDIQAPALVYVTETQEARLLMTAPKFTNDEDLRRAFVRAYERKQVKYPVRRVWSASGTQQVRFNETSEDEEILQRINEVHMNDLLNTISVSLTDQVFRHPDLSEDQYNALVKYVYTLINYFPFKNDSWLKFFKRLHAWLQNQVSPIDMAEYKKQFHDWQDVFGKHDWFACKSLSSINSLVSSSRRSAGLLFENPAQFGKVVSNITRLFRTNQQKLGQLKNLIGMLTSRSSTPVVLGGVSPGTGGSGSLMELPAGNQGGKFRSTTSTTTTSKPNNSKSNAGLNKKEAGGDMASTFEKLFKSVTNGSLGSDSSMLKLISTALTGGASGGKPAGKSKFAREFPCGAWKLAHVMVVNEYLLDSPRKDVRHIVLHSLHQYMGQFYACATCGNRVSDISGELRLNLDEHLLDQGDSIMFLWRIHNRLNKRLESELRPGSPAKQQFPNEQLCAKCRTSKQQPDGLLSTPNWSEKNVFGFLVHHYRPQNIAAATATSESSTSSSSSSAATSSPIARLRSSRISIVGSVDFTRKPDFYLSVLFSFPMSVLSLSCYLSLVSTFLVGRQKIIILGNTQWY